MQIRDIVILTKRSDGRISRRDRNIPNSQL